MLYHTAHIDYFQIAILLLLPAISTLARLSAIPALPLAMFVDHNESVFSYTMTMTMTMPNVLLNINAYSDSANYSL